jgi:hypothetical protein
VRPRWVIALMIVMSGIGLALLGDLIPTAHKLDKWAALAESLIGVSLGLFGYPVFGRGAAIKPADDKQPPMSGAAVVLVLAAGMLIAGAGCATARASAVGTKHAVSEATAKAAVDFAKYDAEHQLEIVDRAPSREVARADLKAWRIGPQRKILMAFDGVNRSLELLTAALKAADAGAKQDWLGLARAILDAARALTEALKEFDVPVPFTLPKLSLAPTPLLRDSLWFAEPLGDYIALDNKPVRQLPPMPDGVSMPPGVVGVYLCDELNCTPCTGGWSSTTTNVFGGAP